MVTSAISRTQTTPAAVTSELVAARAPRYSCPRRRTGVVSLASFTPTIVAGHQPGVCFCHDGGVSTRVLVFSHACVVPANQAIYGELRALGYEVLVVAPESWTNDYSAGPFRARALDALTDSFLGLPVVRSGAPQRFRYRGSLHRNHVIRSFDPDVCIIEEEAFSLAGWQCARFARSRELPYAIQAAENLNRSLPWPAKLWRRRVLRFASLVMARSKAAGERAAEWGAVRSNVEVVPHAIDAVIEAPAPRPEGVVGYVGRLVESKGITDLLAAVRNDVSLRLEVAGDGPLRALFEAEEPRVRWHGALSSTQLADFYEAISVLALPSRTTSTWSEQFGRVIIEALAAGRPVVAYDSGEIPWVADLTGITLVSEGDIAGLTSALHENAFGALGVERAARGREVVKERFTNYAVARQLAAWIDEVTQP